MKRSVRFKLFAFLCGITILFVLFSYGLNTLFLEHYYEQTKKATLNDIFAEIKNDYNGDIDTLSQKLEKDESLHQVRIMIMDKNLNVIYTSAVDTKRFKDNQRNGTYIPPVTQGISSRLAKFTTKPTIEKRIDSRLDSYMLTLFGKITLNSDSVYVMITTPTAAMSGSAGIANQFYLLTGFLTLLIGSILIFFVSKRITKPIVEVNQAAKKLSNLDFSYKIKTKSKDEIGELGESINYLSDKLENAILSLTQANAKLQEDIEEKDKIDEMRKEFISNVSHELKTPLSLIMGYAEGLKLNINENEKDYYCDVISDEALKMNKLVMRLLDIAQLESGYVQISKSDFDLLQCIDENIAKNKILLDDKNVKVSYDKSTDYMVNSDYDLTDQVFSNILSNAINHVNDNGIIRIRVEPANDKIIVRVFNSGNQIPEECLDKIWDSFYKVDKSRTREYGGSGLGLTIIKTILDMEKNAYGVRNLDDGVEFWFEIDPSIKGTH